MVFNQVDLCEEYKAKIIIHGQDYLESKELATMKAEEEGLHYVDG